MCGDISNYKKITKQIRQNGMKWIDSQNDLAPSPPNLNLDSVFCNVLNLSTIDPPNYRIQRTLEIIEIDDQNVCGVQSNVDRFTLRESLDQVNCTKLGIKHYLVLDKFWVAIHLEIMMAGIVIVRLIIKTYLVLILFKVL